MHSMSGSNCGSACKNAFVNLVELNQIRTYYDDIPHEHVLFLTGHQVVVGGHGGQEDSFWNRWVLVRWRFGLTLNHPTHGTVLAHYLLMSKVVTHNERLQK